MPSGFHTWSQTAANNATADSAINWAEGQAPSTVNDSARAENAVLAKWRDDINGSLTTGGSSTAYTVTTNTGFTTLALMDKQFIAIVVHTTSGATPTLNVDSLGAKPIRNATGATLPTGALVSGSVYRMTYFNTAGEFLIHNQEPIILAANSVTTSNITDANVTLAKIVNTSASRLLGNPTGAPAAPSEISLGTGLSFSGTALNSVANPASFPGFLSGLILSAAGGTGTFGIAAGAATDTTNAAIMALASAYTKTTASWVVGSGNGALDTGAVAINTWYHVYLIQRTDTGVVDVLFSTSASAPTMPASYTLKRRIGAMKTDASSQWIAFTQIADDFIWSASVADVSGISTTTSRVNKVLTVPTGAVVKSLLRVQLYNSGASVSLAILSLIESDQAPGNTTNFANVKQGGGAEIAASLEVFTDTSAQISVRASNTGSSYSIYTYGWKDTRGK